MYNLDAEIKNIIDEKIKDSFRQKQWQKLCLLILISEDIGKFVPRVFFL